MAAMLVAMGMSAQQNISFREGDIVSPQVNDDHTVTFRVKAPKAKSVKILADWEQKQRPGYYEERQGWNMGVYHSAARIRNVHLSL